MDKIHGRCDHMDNIKRHKRIIIRIAILLIIIGILNSFTARWRDIDITLHGVQLRIGDSEYIEEKTITIRGRYWRYLFFADRFEGRIEVEGYNFTFSDLVSPISFPNNRNWGTTLTYWCRFGRFAFESLGHIYITPWFSSIMITVWEDAGYNSKSWSTEDGIIIVAPASNREEAAEIAKELTNWACYVEWE